jgi:hypothetical protein
VRSALLLALSCSLFSVELEIPISDWSYRPGVGIRATCGIRDGNSKRELLPASVWKDLNRPGVYIETTDAEFKQLNEQGKWGDSLRQHAHDESDLIWLHTENYSPGYYSPCELEPCLTPEQKKIENSLPAAWLLPTPKGFETVEEGGVINVWKPYGPVFDSRAKCYRRTFSKREGQSGTTERLFWFDHPMSADEMTLQAIANDGQLDIRKQFDHQILWHHSNDSFEKDRPIVCWQSGQFLVWIEAPREVYKDIVQNYIEKYPPTWDSDLRYEPTRLALGVLDQSLLELEQHVDGPLEYLRYSFRRYPFDIALTRCFGVLPGSGAIKRAYEARLAEIQEAWAATPADQIKLSDYRDAIVSYRREIISTIRAARDRIAAHGIEHKGPNRQWDYGDQEIPKDGSQ